MWSFPRAGAQHSNSSPKLNEFFNDQDASTALVREAVQNSLDAVLDKDEPVRVRFSIDTFSWDKLAPYLETEVPGESIDCHLSSKDLGKFAKSLRGKHQRCLIIEDTGTKGLIGSTDKDNAHSGSNFVGFWWNDGISGKGKGSSGSHGVGKTTLTRISNMSMFLAVTKRSDDNRRFLLGFANLPYHRIGDSSYLGYGRFGSSIGKAENEKFMPIEDAVTIEKFLSDFAISRNETGLTVFIPGIPSSVTNSGLLLAAVRDYYWPILKGELIVEVFDKTSGDYQVINASNIAAICQKLADENESSASEISDTTHRVEMARDMLALRFGGNPNWFMGNEPTLRTLNNGQIRGEFSKDHFSDDNLQHMLHAFDSGQLVGFSFSLKFETTDGQEQVGIVEVFFRKNDIKLIENAQFIRNQIIITNQKSGIPAKNVACFLIAEDQDMSDYLKEAEEPAHTRWFIKRFNEQKSYTSDWALRFVSDLPAILYKILSREDEEASTYENFADDIFSIVQPEGKGARKKRKKTPEKTAKPSDIPPSKKRDVIRVDRDGENPGFEILPVSNIEEIFEEEELALPFEVTVKAAYVSALGRSRSWKDYSKIDFEFGKSIPVDLQPEDAAKLVSASENSFTVEILQPNFRISAKGFDRNRDLLVHPRIKL